MMTENKSKNEEMAAIIPVSVFDRKPEKKGFPFDSIFTFIVRSSGFLVFIVTVLVFIFIVIESYNVFGYISPVDLIYSYKNGQLHFEWYPTSNDPRFSLIPLLLGTLLTAIPATIVSTFFGVGIGIFISEFAHYKIKNYLKHLIDLFAALPTVAVGFILLTVGVTFFDSIFEPGNRLNAVLAALGLSIIIIPQIASLTEEALSGIPDEIRMAAYSLGAGRWRTIKDIVFPAAINGISASIVLGFGRAIGDTMIVLMISGNAANLTLNPFQSVRTMTATIAAELGEVSTQTAHYHALFFIGLILFIMSILVNLIVKYLVRRIGFKNNGEV